jgi:HAD superfamily hydrolase (TIGR01484 family)
MIRHKALVVDYDGTLAHNGLVTESTIDALLRVRRSGRKLILCTGREIRYLAPVFPRMEIFDIIVAENGGTLFFPDTKEEVLLADPPQREFVEALGARDIELSVGKTIVATWEPFQQDVLEEIRKFGLELHVIFNKGAVMVLPTAVTKASGLFAALKHLSLSAHNIAGVGDAENDHAFLKTCETSIAVANALPSLKAQVDHVTCGDHGQGVEEIAAKLLEDDLLSWRSSRHDLRIGKTLGGDELKIGDRGNILVIGASGSGKSAFTTNLLDGLLDRRFQVLVIDPEGDYERFEKMLTFGDGKSTPSPDLTADALRGPAESVIANLIAVKLDARPRFMQEIYPKFLELRAKYGRPHWLIVDEAHHMLEEDYRLPEPESSLFITVHPKRLPQSVLDCIDTVIAVGVKGEEALSELLPLLGLRASAKESLDHGEALVWKRRGAITKIKLEEPGRYHFRHRRKYAEGNLGEERSFVFVGPDGKLRLRAVNLRAFLEIADGVDDGTWDFHLREHDYSRWLRREIKDEDLAREVEVVENADLDSLASRSQVRELVERYYVVER